LKRSKKVTIIFTIVVESLSSRIISKIFNPLGSIPKVLISKLSELKLIVCQVVDKAKLGKTLTLKRGSATDCAKQLNETKIIKIFIKLYIDLHLLYWWFAILTCNN
jgi:hypothetical protein